MRSLASLRSSPVRVASVTLLAILLLAVVLHIAPLRALLFPEPLHWPDRRPIASLVLASAATHWPRNPRGWFIDPSVDITTPAGIHHFHDRLLAWADRSVTIMQQMHAQGMITWDIEGEQFPHRTTYIGDPRLVGELAPEMSGVVDAYFKRFRDAGFRVGVTVRPQQLLVENNSQTARQVPTPDPAAILIAKITYAQRRWGATLFYLDSNWNSTGFIAVSSGVIARVAQAVPGVLLIPEHATPDYYGISAPYTDTRNTLWGTPGVYRRFYPRAFSIINLEEMKPTQYPGAASALRDGDVALFRGWFADPANGVIQQMSEARQ